jgi:sterol desaturase/sphingolipid hydroxylase (fatty acid hydroxylase superfamily)
LIPILVVLVAVAWLLGYPLTCMSIILGGIAWVAHDRPELMFWMKMPSHHVHHTYHQWHHNFGVTVDWWDHVFGTYKEMPWHKPETPLRWRDFLDSRWR